jgi:peptide/nickel transport system substrate-binding protein/oligopeptide transport system substrate-binding protein
MLACYGGKIFSYDYRNIANLIILLLFFSVFSDSAESQNQPHYGGTYRAPLTSEPISLDPALYTDIYSMSVAANVFDGLVEFDPDLNVVPAIARRWKIARDYRTYTFQLREGVKFHHGREVTADDFVYSFSRILNPQTKSPIAPFFLHIQGAEAYYEGNSDTVAGLSAPSPYTLQIRLKEPFAPFLSILAMINAKLVPHEMMTPDFARQPVGTGPFRFGSWNPGKEIVLDANPDYFDGRPFIDHLQFRIYLNIEWEQIFEDFKKGQLEHALIPSGEYDRILTQTSGQKAYTIFSKSGLNLVYIGMNMEVTPFADLRVRQAINYAVDSEAIVTHITRRGSIPVQGLVPPGLAGFDPDFKAFSYDPEKARELLKEAGYTDGRGFPAIELWTVSKSESVQKELQEYQRYLGEIGLQVSVKIADNWKEFVRAISDKKAALFYAAWYADYPDPDNFFYPLVYSESVTNRMHFRDPQVDQLLDAARSEMDYLKRADLYRNLNQLVMHSAPLISQHVNSNNYLFRSSVKDIEMSSMGVIYLPFRKIWFETE